MYKMFIADDEHLVIKSLKASINWEEYGFEVIGEAHDAVCRKCKAHLLGYEPAIGGEQIRFGDRLQVCYNFTEEALKCRIQKMMQQPVLENAIYHGLETKLNVGTEVSLTILAGGNFHVQSTDM